MNDPFINPETGEPDDTGQDSQPSASRAARLAVWLSIAALCFTAIGITVGYKHWVRISDKAKLALREISTLQQQLAAKAEAADMQRLHQTLETTSEKHLTQLETSLTRLEEVEQKTSYAASTVQQQIVELTRLQSPPESHDRISRSTVRLAEIRFMLEAASQRLHLDYDKPGAMSLLQSADRMLIQIGSGELLPVREKLAEDIVRLENYDLPELEPLLDQVATLESEIKPLAVLEQENTTGDSIQVFDIAEEADPDALGHRLKKYLNDSVTIRRNPSSPKQNLSSSNKERIDQLIQLRLASLRIHISQRQDQEFHHQISQIRDLLERFYLPEQNQAWLQRLDAMDQITLNPEQPAINSALDALAQIRQKDANT